MGRTNPSGSRKRSRNDDEDYDGGKDNPTVEVLIAHDPMLALDSDDDIDFGEMPGSGLSGGTSGRQRRNSQSSSTTSSGKTKRNRKKKKKEEEEEPEEPEVDNEEIFYVEKIKDKRWNVNLSRWEYLLAWQGYGPEHDTWEPTENMDCDDLLAEFEAEWTKKPHYGFDRGEIAREIIGMVEIQEDNNQKSRAFIVMYKGSDHAEYVPIPECVKHCPNLVIEFYESRQIGLIGQDMSEMSVKEPSGSAASIASESSIMPPPPLPPMATTTALSS